MDTSIINIVSKYPDTVSLRDTKGGLHIIVTIKDIRCFISYINGKYAMALNDTMIMITSKSSDICQAINDIETKELIFGNDHPMFKIAKSNVTNLDVEYVKNLTENSVSEDEARMMTAEIRWKNRICNYCWDKNNILKLFFCDKCYLVQYCSTECQEKDLDNHRKRCCNPNGPLDKGPQRFAVANCSH